MPTLRSFLGGKGARSGYLLLLGAVLLFILGSAFAGASATQASAVVSVPCSFYMSTSVTPVYLSPSNIIANYTLRGLNQCGLPSVSGIASMISNLGQYFLQNVTLNGFTTANTVYSVTLNGLGLPSGNYMLNTTLSHLNSGNKSSTSFSIVSPAVLQFSGALQNLQVPIGAPITLVDFIVDSGNLNANQILVNVKVTGPGSSVNFYNASVAPISSGGDRFLSFTFNTPNSNVGNYTVQQNLTYQSSFYANVIQNRSITLNSTYSVFQPTQSGGGGGGGGNGGGGGGGSIQRPIILPVKDGFIVLNIAPLNIFNVTLDGLQLNFTDNFISPNDTGMTINDKSYTLFVNQTLEISHYEEPNYNYTVKLLNISYIPVLHTVAIEILGLPIIVPINVEAQNFTTDIITSNTLPDVINLLGEKTTLVITSNALGYKALTITNITNSKLVPLLPPDYVKQLVQNVSLKAVDQASLYVNTTINVTMAYSCGMAPEDVVPFILANASSWRRINSYTVKPKECTINFEVFADPILALTNYVGARNITTVSTTTIPSQNSASTTTIQTSVTQASSIELYEKLIAIFAATVIIAALLWLVLSKRRKREEAEPESTEGRGQEPVAVSSSRQEPPRREVPAAVQKQGKPARPTKKEMQRAAAARRAMLSKARSDAQRILAEAEEEEQRMRIKSGGKTRKEAREIRREIIAKARKRASIISKKRVSRRKEKEMIAGAVALALRKR